ncbi:MAG TPA: hypothetical protein VL334_18185 [Anaerolineae bacterium]|nr:hypothetical protein [Anaerolineae bacterium]
MRLLVVRVQGQPAPAKGDGRVELVLLPVDSRQLTQDPGRLPTQPLGQVKLPVVEAGAIAQAEASQEFVASDRFTLP